MKKIILNGYKILLDDEDFSLIKNFHWYIEKNNEQLYANARIKGSENKNIRMHQLIFGKRKNFVIDHIDGNGLNNQKSNLRFVNRSINGLNSKRTKGYYYDKIKKKFVCRAVLYGETINLGRFRKEVDAKNCIRIFRKCLNQKWEVLNGISFKDIIKNVR